MRKTTPAKVSNVQVNDPVWGARMELVRSTVLPYQWQALNDQVPGVPPSGAMHNFRIAAGDEQGTFRGKVFQDSDLAKWLEAVAYSLAVRRDEELERTADAAIDVIVRAQQSDGYLNTYFTVAEPAKRWTNVRDQHELYCAGHMMEAAVAYYEATGKRRLLDAMCRFADHIGQVFGRNEGQKRGYPGHPEAELALVKLYRATGERRYLEIARYFVDERGRQPHWYTIEAEARGESPQYPWHNLGYAYSQAHLPVREQTTAEGHAVRALYLFCGMVDVALETGDEGLLEASRRLWHNVTQRRMYVTGAVGSDFYGERFTFDYDLPNDRAYAETCANIALVFWAHRMLQAEVDGTYADTMERALYNGVLSGISLDGKRFFYVNPLAVWPEACAHRYDLRDVKPVRQGWFDCACCPPNIARLIASIGQYIYGQGPDTAYVHLYAASEADLDVAGTRVRLVQETDYPWGETVALTVHPARTGEFTVAVRIPGWCRGARLSVGGQAVPVEGVMRRGYARIQRVWQEGDRIELTLPMPVERVRSHPRVRENAGRVALQRGPLVYCLEEVDNGPNLSAIILPAQAELRARWAPDLLGGVMLITGEANREDETAWGDALYRSGHVRGTAAATITAVPYALWCNRTPGEMLVWIREE